MNNITKLEIAEVVIGKKYERQFLLTKKSTRGSWQTDANFFCTLFYLSIFFVHFIILNWKFDTFNLYYVQRSIDIIVNFGTSSS